LLRGSPPWGPHGRRRRPSKLARALTPSAEIPCRNQRTKRWGRVSGRPAWH
jgi:hypothetical protein